MLIRRKAAHRGMIFLALLFLILVVGTLVGLCAYQTQTSLLQATHQESVLKAEYAARAGIDIVLSTLEEEGPEWQPATATFEIALPSALGGEVKCRIEMYNNYTGDAPRSVVTSDGSVTIPPHRVWVKATGLVNGKPLNRAKGQAEALLVKPDLEFKAAIAASDLLLGKDQKVLSYSSDPVKALPMEDYAGTRGGAGLRTFPGDNKRVVGRYGQERLRILFGGCVIDGGILTAGAVPQIDGGSTVTGSIEADGEDPSPIVFRMPKQYREQPSPSFHNYSNPSTALSPGRYGTITVHTSGTLLLEPGGEYCIDNLTLNNNSVVHIAPGSLDPVVIYLSSGLTVNQGAEINWSTNPVPSRLQICATDQGGEGETVIHLEVDSRSSFVAAGHWLRFIAPCDRDVQFSGAFYGGTFETVTGPWPMVVDNKFFYDTELSGWEPTGKPCWVVAEETRD